MSWTIILDHLFMVLAASTLAIIIGIPLGILAYMYPKTKAVILNLVDILQTIPALALLGLIMIVAGAGKTTVILGIMLYSLLPIARNTYLGLSEIDPGIKEAAKGVGMTGFERLTKVEFPIAYPTIFTGIRIGVTTARTLGQMLKIPCIKVSSLEGILYPPAGTITVLYSSPFEQM